MLLPAMQYGEWKDVRPRARAAARRVIRGESIVDVVAEGGLVDTAATPGMVVVSGTLPGVASFYSLEPWKQLMEAIARVPERDRRLEIEEAVFRASIIVPWGVLGLMSPSNTLWFAGHPDWERPYLDAALAAWDQIDAVGSRYYLAFRGQRMWELPNSLGHVLARAGVPADRMRAPLPPGGPAALLKYASLAS